MVSRIDLDKISDGRLYDIDDWVNADTEGCDGCNACCHGIGDLVVLNPFDIHNIVSQLNCSFDELLNDKIELHERGKLTLPHLRASEGCAFLNTEGRCSIHENRPDICRLFPLGRVYENDNSNFKYFLQIDSCKKRDLKKVKVRDWIGVKDYPENKAFLLDWHRLIKALSFRVKFIRDAGELKEVNEYLMDTFYRISTTKDESFYTAFNAILAEAKSRLGII